jgi:hypothetical protein
MGAMSWTSSKASFSESFLPSSQPARARAAKAMRARRGRWSKEVMVGALAVLLKRFPE